MLKFYPKKRETLCTKLAFFDYFIDKSLRFFINSKQMIKFRARLSMDEVFICVDYAAFPGGEGGPFMVDEGNGHVPNNTAKYQHS